MNTVTSNDLYNLISSPISADRYDGYVGTPYHGVYGLGFSGTSMGDGGFGGLLGDIFETLKKPVAFGIPLWGVIAGGVVLATVVLPMMKKRR